ncbi:spirocyclase AveC family protein [Streptomyces sp. NPDC001680]
MAGAVFLAVQTWVIGRWLAAAGPTQKITSSYEISQTRRTVLTVCELAVIAAVAACAVWIIRDMRRKGHVSIHAALFLGYGTAHWMDPILNYGGWGFANNRYVHHVNSWGPFLPGWRGPEVSPQPLIYATGLFFPLLIGLVWITLAVAVKISTLHPHWGRARIAAAVVVPTMMVDVLAESLIIRSGAYAYVGAPPQLSLFGGHWYQIPLTELILWPVVFAIPTVMLILSPRMTGQEVAIFAGTPPSGGIRHGAVRLLAGIGFAHVTLLIWLVGVGLSLRHQGIPADTPSFLRL